MRKDRIDKVIELIKATPAKHFDMNQYLKPITCGTAGCIAGFASMLATRSKPTTKYEAVRRRVDERTAGCFDLARHYLQLEYGAASDLFLPAGHMMDLVRKKHAIKALRVLKKNGDFRHEDWKTILGVPKAPRRHASRW